MNIKELKFTVLGAPSVGKSSLTIQFIKGSFLGCWDGTIEDTYRKQVEIDGCLPIIEVLDPIQEVTPFREEFLKQCHGLILLYSIIDRDSFMECKMIYNSMIQALENQDLSFVLVGNKLDLDESRVVTTEEGINLAKEFKNCIFFEVSAKTNTNVTECFNELNRSLLKKIPVNVDKKEKKCLLQ